MRTAVVPALAIALLAGCGSPPAHAPSPPVVGTALVGEAAGLAPAITHVGTLAGEVEIDLSFKLAGRVLDIGPDPGRDWREGDAIAEGQTAARLDTAELLETVRAAEARAQNDVSLHERGAKLMADRLISQQDLDKLTAARDASSAIWPCPC